MVGAYIAAEIVISDFFMCLSIFIWDKKTVLCPNQNRKVEPGGKTGSRSGKSRFGEERVVDHCRKHTFNTNNEIGNSFGKTKICDQKGKGAGLKGTKWVPKEKNLVKVLTNFNLRNRLLCGKTDFIS